MGSATAIRTALQNRLAALPSTIDTVREGERYDPKPDVPYQTVSLVRFDPLNPTYGDAYYREQGLLRVRLFYPDGKGSGAATRQAEAIREWFPRGSSYESDGIVTTITRTPAISTGAIVRDRYVLTVDIRFHASVYANS